MTKKACAQCPWRLANQGKRHPHRFYTKRNLTRLWNQIRGGGAPQSCHLTDPSHPDHVKVGAPLGATPQECPGSVIVVLRELERMTGGNGGMVEPEHVNRYVASRPRGLTRRGIVYWVVQRIQMAGVPFFGESKLPDVDVDDAEIGLPAWMEER